MVDLSQKSAGCRNDRSIYEPGAESVLAEGAWVLIDHHFGGASNPEQKSASFDDEVMIDNEVMIDEVMMK